MIEKFNKNAKFEQLTKMFSAVGRKKALSLKILSSRAERLMTIYIDTHSLIALLATRKFSSILIIRFHHFVRNHLPECATLCQATYQNVPNHLPECATLCWATYQSVPLCAKPLTRVCHFVPSHLPECATLCRTTYQNVPLCGEPVDLEKVKSNHTDHIDIWKG